MTGNDHTDALHGDVVTGALRSPALPFERVHEAAVLAEMVDALTTAPEPSSLRRHRRVVAFAAVTIASLGVGGIIAAGPGGFRPAVNDNTPPAAPVFDDDVPAPAPDDFNDNDSDNDNDSSGGTERITTDPDFECAEDTTNHGRTVSSAATTPGSNRAAAQSECGKPMGSGNRNGNRNGDESRSDDDGDNERITTDPDFECAEDTTNHGRTVSSAAATPGSNRAAAQSECGKPVASSNGNRDNGNDNGRRETGNRNTTTTTQPAG